MSNEKDWLCGGQEDLQAVGRVGQHSEDKKPLAKTIGCLSHELQRKKGKKISLKVLKDKY